MLQKWLPLFLSFQSPENHLKINYLTLFAGRFSIIETNLDWMSSQNCALSRYLALSTALLAYFAILFHFAWWRVQVPISLFRSDIVIVND